jgi:hypothetical protein
VDGQLHEEHGASQEELVDATNLYCANIPLIESGKRPVRLEAIEPLANALRIEQADRMPAVRL